MKKEMCECEGGCCSGHGGKIMALVALVLLAGIFAAVVFTAGSMSVDPAQQKLMSVSGTVTKMVAPDKVEIVFAIETLNTSAQLSQSSNATIADNVVSALKNSGVLNSQIKTQGYSVQEEFEWNDTTKKSESVGYRTTNTIQVTLSDVSAAGKTVDTAIASGANKVSGITFGLSKEKELEVRTIALNEASEVAFTKATSIASGLNINLGKVKSVAENGFYYTPNYQNVEMVKAAGDFSAPTPITAGDVEVNASVSVSYEIN